MRYVVTGGAGFIGSHISEALAAGDHEVIIIDDLSSGRIGNIRHLLDSNSVTFHRGSITDLPFLRRHIRGIDGIFHQAAFVSVPRSIADPIRNHEINITGTLNVLTTARDGGVQKVILASSAAVYGNLPGLPKHEEMPVDPRSPYALAKLTGEYYGRLFSRLYGVQTIALRYFNVYGPRQDPHSDYAAVIPKFIHRLMNGEPPVIYGDGEQTRDFVFVSDVVQANIRAMQSDARGVFNVALGHGTSLNELAEKIMALTGHRMSAVHEKERQGEVKHSVADIIKAKESFGFLPLYGFEQGLLEMIGNH